VKRLEWINGDKAKIETGLKAFDRFCTCIMTGNHIGDGHSSAYVRPWNEIECNGKKDYEPGHLQNFDLKPWREHGLPRNVDEYLVAFAKDECVILNKFWHYRRGNKVVHGYIITRGDKHCHRLLAQFCTGPTSKSRDVLNWCRDYVSNLSEVWYVAEKSTVRYGTSEHPCPIFLKKDGTWTARLSRAAKFIGERAWHGITPVENGVWLSLDDANYYIRTWKAWEKADENHGHRN
jgi:hypothetical protein